MTRSFNIASSALLTMMVVEVCKLMPGTFVHTFGDLPLCANHLDQAFLQITRQPHPLPQMRLNPAVKRMRDFQYADFELTGCNPHPDIKAPIGL